MVTEQTPDVEWFKISLAEHIGPVVRLTISPHHKDYRVKLGMWRIGGGPWMKINCRFQQALKVRRQWAKAGL
jgi:hypothetical protein